MGYNHQASLENTVHGYTVRGTPNRPLIHVSLSMVTGLRRKAMSLPGNGERSTNHDADLARFSLCWVQSHETRRNQCFKIELPIINLISIEKHVQQQKNYQKNTSFKLSNISFKH